MATYDKDTLPLPAFGAARVMSPEAIRAWREGHQLTQDQMGELLKLKSGGQVVSNWESGRAKPQPYLDLALAELTRRLELWRRTGWDPR